MTISPLYYYRFKPTFISDHSGVSHNYTLIKIPNLLPHLSMVTKFIL
jgi:hypothetical protein